MKPNLKWSPPVKINSNNDNSMIAAGIHFSETKKMYGPQYLVNLIDKKGSQFNIGVEFGKVHRLLADPDLSYFWFDFHAECKAMKWENLSKLVTKVQKEIEQYGHFIAEI